MTVRSANYSSLDEVWGESFNSSSKPKKEKRKKIVDPICDLYQMGNNTGYTDNDLVSYANNYFEKYDKTPYNRTMNNHVNQHVNDQEDNDVLPKQYHRERPVRQVTISDDRETYDVTEVDDVPLEQEPKINKQQPKEQFYASRYYNDDDEEPDNKTTNFAFIDLLLYVISGIILIFVMEQFVKIGLLLQ
jgi:hypothetical protein